MFQNAKRPKEFKSKLVARTRGNICLDIRLELHKHQVAELKLAIRMLGISVLLHALLRTQQMLPDQFSHHLSFL